MKVQQKSNILKSKAWLGTACDITDIKFGQLMLDELNGKNYRVSIFWIICAGKKQKV